MNNPDILIYLTSCVVNHISPEPLKAPIPDREEFMQFAADHQMSAIAAYGLRAAGLEDNSSAMTLYSAVGTDRQFDAERKKILERLEENGIWYLPLKGVVLKKMYPMPFLRQMSDNDILFQAERAADVREIMTGLGYQTDIFDSEHRDDYKKPPVYHFEMHRVLFDEEAFSDGFYEYFSGTTSRMIRDPDNRYGYHLSDEDFYIYMIAHEYKHYTWAGTGIRSLLDTYVFLRERSEQMDWKYIGTEMDKLGLREFEKENRNLAQKIFSGGDISGLSEKDRKRLNYYVQSGAYGRGEQIFANYVHKTGTARYVFRRIFLPGELVKEHYPFFYEHKLFIPLLPIYRIVRQRKNAVREIRALFKIGRKR